MKIIRYEDSRGAIHYGCQHSETSVTRLTGDLFAGLTDTSEPAEVKQLLAPLVPVDIICIGLNYRKHAAEGNSPIPTFPVVFMKNIGTLQNPGQPIVLPSQAT